MKSSYNSRNIDKLFLKNKKMKIIQFLTVTSILLTSINSYAVTGNDILRDCRSEPGVNSGYCMGLIVGYTNGYNSGRKGGAIFQKFGNMPLDIIQANQLQVNKISNDAAYYCTPSTVTIGQLVDVVTSYLDKNPTTRHLEADVLIWMAMKQAFPCK